MLVWLRCAGSLLVLATILDHLLNSLFTCPHRSLYQQALWRYRTATGHGQNGQNHNKHQTTHIDLDISSSQLPISRNGDSFCSTHHHNSMPAHHRKHCPLACHILRWPCHARHITVSKTTAGSQGWMPSGVTDLRAVGHR